MRLEVISPESTLFEGEVNQATLQTYIGEITILPEHMPLVSIIKPGTLKIVPNNAEEYNTQTFVFNQEKITISIGDGIAYTDGQNIKLVVQSGNRGTNNDTDQLQKDIQKREEILANARKDNNQEVISNATTMIETLKSHLSLQQD